jgi:hypothetical protein
VITEDLVVTPEAVTDIAAAAHGEPIGCTGGYGGVVAVVIRIREGGTDC